MSREVVSRVHVCYLALFLSTLCKASYSTVSPVDCLEFDISELENYLSEVHLENVPTINMMIGEFKCPATALPFGALKSDWARLLLLQRAQLEGSILREKLGRLFRILAVAYFQIDERFDITKPAHSTTSSSAASFARGTTAASEEEAEERGRLIFDSGETNKTTESFTWPTALGSEEHFDSREVEETTLAASNVTEVDDEREGTDGILNNSSSSFGSETSRNVVNYLTELISENPNHSGDNPRNGTTNDNSRGTNQLSATQTEQEINNTGSMFLVEEAFSSGQGLVKGQSSANDVQNESGTPGLMKVGSITDHFRGVEHTTDAFVGAKSSATEVVAEADTLSTDDGFEPITFPVSEPNTFGTSSGGSTFSLNSVGDHKSRTMNVEEEEEKEGVGAGKEEEGIKESGFAGNIQTTTTEIAEADPRNMTTVGDPSLFYTLMNLKDQENTVDVGKGSELTTAAFRGVAGFNLVESANTSDPGIPDVKSTIGPSHVPTDRILGDGVPSRSFFEEQSVREGSVFGSPAKTPRNFTNSAVYRNKIRKLSVSREPPLDKKFWRSIVISRNVTSAGSSNPVLATSRLTKNPDQDRDTESKRFRLGPARSKKRGSLNTDAEKNFRWFYNIGREKKDYASAYQRGIRIECNGDGHDNGGQVS